MRPVYNLLHTGYDTTSVVRDDGYTRPAPPPRKTIQELAEERAHNGEGLDIPYTLGYAGPSASGHGSGYGTRTHHYNINLRDPKTLNLLHRSVASSVADHDPRSIDPSNGITPIEVTVETENATTRIGQRTVGGRGTTTPRPSPTRVRTVGGSGTTTPTTPRTVGGSGTTTPTTPRTVGGRGTTTPTTPRTVGGRGTTTPTTPRTVGGSGTTTPRTPTIVGGPGSLPPQRPTTTIAPGTNTAAQTTQPSTTEPET